MKDFLTDIMIFLKQRQYQSKNVSLKYYHQIIRVGNITGMFAMSVSITIITIGATIIIVSFISNITISVNIVVILVMIIFNHEPCIS